jgi:solute carrier family 25 phosphate transporter 23/24/25/41
MQAIRILARRVTNPKLMRRIYRPSVLQQTEDEALEVPNDLLKRRVELEDDALTTQEEIAELFHQMDSDRDGKLSIDEVSKALRTGKIPTSHTSLAQLAHFSGVDQNYRSPDEQQLMGFAEFVDLIRRRKETLHEAYYWILKHKLKGKFSSGTLRIAAQKSGVHLSDLEIRLIRHQLGGKSSLTYSDFVGYLLLAPEVNPRYFLDQWYTDAFCDDAESQFSTPRDIRVNDEISFAHAAAKKLSCGGIAGAMSRTLTAPLDRIRVVLMTTTEQLGAGRALSLITRNGGYAQLWMGNGVNCLKIAPEVGIKLLSFDMFKNRLAQDPSNVTVQERFIAGGMAGVLSQVSVYPFEVIKTRLSMSTSGEALGMLDCARQTMSEGGYRAFYAGM